MATRENLDESIKDLSEYLPEEVIDRYRETSFRKPSLLERSVDAFVTNDGAGFVINDYAQFLDEGTRFIRAQPFITPVIDDENGQIEEILTIGFEKDIYEAIESTAKQGGGTVS